MSPDSVRSTHKDKNNGEIKRLQRREITRSMLSTKIQEILTHLCTCGAQLYSNLQL